MTTEYRTEESARAEDVMNSVDAATKAGFTEQVVDEGHTLCQKPDTMELVDIFPDGSWEWQNMKEDGEMEEMSGANAALLRMFLSSDENKALFFKHAGDDE